MDHEIREPRPDVPHDGQAARTGWRPVAATALALSLVVLLCLATDLFFFNGYYASDDMAYFDSAARLAHHGSWEKLPRFGGDRLTVVGWCILFGLASRFDVQAMSASFSLVHAAIVVLGYFLARGYGGRRAGLMAAYVLATLPVLIIYSTGIFPDHLVAAFLMLACLEFQAAFAQRGRGRPWLAAMRMLWSGMAVGLAYMAKETGLLALPVFFFAWIAGELALRRSTQPAQASAGPARPTVRPATARPSWLASVCIGGLFAIGFFAMFGLESALLSKLSGESFFRLGWTSEVKDIESLDAFHADGGYSPLGRLSRMTEVLNDVMLPPAIFWGIAGSLVVWPFLRPKAMLAFFLGVFSFAYLIWGSYSFSHYAPPRMQARYFIPALPFLVVVLCATLNQLFRRLEANAPSPAWRRGLLIIAAVVFIAHPFFFMKGSGRMAGTLYRTAFVRNAAAAMNSPAFTGDRLIASRYLCRRFRPMWYRGLPETPDKLRPSHVVESSELTHSELESLLIAPGFNYVEYLAGLPRERVEIGRLHSLDALLAPLLSGHPIVRYDDAAGKPSRGGVFHDVEFFAALETGEPGRALWNGREIRARMLAEFSRRFKSRWSELRYHLRSLPYEYKDYVLPSGDAVAVFGITSQVRRGEPRVVMDSRTTDMAWRLLPSAAAGESLPPPGLQRLDEGGFTLQLTGSAVDVALGYGPDGRAEAEFDAASHWLRIQPGQLVTYEIEASMQAADGNRAVVNFDVFDESAPGYLRVIPIPLRNGRTIVGYFADDLERLIGPRIAISGRGSFTLQRLHVIHR